MKHQTRDHEQIVERYLSGRLEPAEEIAFEEHYIGCPECLDRLDEAKAFGDGLRQLATEDAMRRSEVGRVGSRRPPTPSWRSQRAGLLAIAASLAVVLALGFLTRQLVTEKAHGMRLAEMLESSVAPQANPLIVPLGTLRGAGSATAPAARLRLPTSPRWLILELELDRPEHERYRAVLSQGDAEPLWSADDLLPNERDTVTVGLHSTFLAPGDYSVRVEVPRPDRGPLVVATFVFRVETRGEAPAIE